MGRKESNQQQQQHTHVRTRLDRKYGMSPSQFCVEAMLIPLHPILTGIVFASSPHWPPLWDYYPLRQIKRGPELYNFILTILTSTIIKNLFCRG